MSKVVCQHCSSDIPSGDVNVGEGVAFCRACDKLSRLASMVEAISADPPINADPDDRPRGCSLEDRGDDVRIRASARSIGGAIGALIFGGFWNGIVSIFVLLAIAGTIQYFTGDVPSWFPAPQSDGEGASGDSLSFDSGGTVLFLWVFLTPFILVGAVVTGYFLFSLFGRCEVRVRRGRGRIFTGFGPIGWSRGFDPAAVSAVRLGRTKYAQDGEHKPCIIIEGDDTHRLGASLSDRRRKWMAAVLRDRLAGGGGPGR